MNIFKSLHEMTSPDKQFRDSLEHYKKSPPPQAWNRIESGLHTTKARNTWMSVAATVILLISASFLLLHSNENQTTTPFIAIDQNCATEIIHQTPVTQTITEPIASPKTESEPISISYLQKPNSIQKITTPLQEKVNSTDNVSNEILTETPVSQTEITPIISEPAAAPTSTADVASVTLRSNKIVYSSGEVNSRFLKKETTTNIPIPVPEKPQTGIQKIIEIAGNLKYEENALGELREMKNEILSLPRKETTGDKNK